MHGFRNNYFSFHLCSKMFQFLVKIRLLRATKGIKNGQLLFLLCTAVQISEQAIVRKAKTNKFHRSSDDNEAIFLPIFRKILTRLVAIFPKRNYFIEGKVKTALRGKIKRGKFIYWDAENGGISNFYFD